MARSSSCSAGARLWRSRWAAIGAAVAVTLGAGGLYSVRAASDPSVFVPITPTRILDTRINAGLAGVLTSARPRLLDVTGTIPIVQPGGLIGSGAPVPDGATAIVANVTAVAPATEGFVSVRPGNITGNPTTSNLNTRANIVSPNLVTVEIPTSGPQTGQIQLWYQGLTSTATTHLLVDIVGYYQPGTGTPGPRGPAGPTGPTGPAGNSAKQQRLVAFTNGPTPLFSDIETQPAIALGADRVPIVAFFNDFLDDLYVVRCVGACGATSPFAVESANSVGWAPSIAIGSDGLAVIAFGTQTGAGGTTGVRVRHCSNVACDASTASALDPSALNQTPTSIAIGTDGFPIIAYAFGTDVRTAHCGDVLCTPGLAVITTHATPVDDQLNVSIVIGSDGLPLIAHQTGPADLAVTRCANVACTSSTQVIADNRSVNVGADAAVAIGADGFPVIAHRILTDGTEAGSDLRITRCTTLTCSSAVSTTVDAGPNRTGYFASIVVGADGVPIVAHRDDTASALKVSRCTDPTCTAVETIPNDAGAGSGFTASMIIDAFGLPVIAHADATANSDIRVTILTNQGWGPG